MAIGADGTLVNTGLHAGAINLVACIASWPTFAMHCMNASIE